MGFLLAGLRIAAAASLPDLYEGPPFNDNTTLTLNILNENTTQSHSIHASTDTDWCIAVQAEDSTEVRTYVLRFIDLTIPVGKALAVGLYLDGPDRPESIHYTVPYDSMEYPCPWSGSGLRFVYFRISPFGYDSTQQTSYSVVFQQISCAQTVVSTAGGQPTIIWSVPDAMPGKGFNLLRSATGSNGSFARMNSTPTDGAPVPGTCPGSCAGTGCASYIGSPVSCGSLTYYRAELVNEDDTTVPWGNTAYSYVPPTCVPVAVSSLSLE